VIVARHCGLRVVALSAISNFAAGMSPEKLSHAITLQGAQQAAGTLSALIMTFLQELNDANHSE
jgi:xanthosine phosphorylase